MTLKDKILVELQSNNYLSDRELADRILGLGQPQQPVNNACRALCDAGYISRTERPIRNYIKERTEASVGAKLIKTDVTRPDYLRKGFNDFWNQFWNTDRDYYSEFTLEKLCELKMAVANIHNLITYQSTLMATELICDILHIPENEATALYDDVSSTSANQSGFDIIHAGSVPFICEVKANVPAGGKGAFGAQQKVQLDKDIQGLLYGKNSSAISKDALKTHWKFLAMYCNQETTVKAIHSYVSNHKENVALWNGQEILEKDCIYVVLVKE